MRIGFTGTRFGMSDAQNKRVRLILIEWLPVEFHQGCCKGSDEEAVAIVREVMSKLGTQCKVVGHPGPEFDPWRSPVLCDEYRKPTSHFARNRNIVNDVDFMIGTPREPDEQQFGGTWYTVRYARKVGRPIEVISP